MPTLLEVPPIRVSQVTAPPPAQDPPSLLDRYRLGYQRRVAAHVDQRLKSLRELKALQGLDAERRTQVLVGMRRLQCQLAGIVVLKRDTMTWLLRASVGLLALYYAFCIPFVVRNAMPEQLAAKRPYLLAIGILLAGAGTISVLAARARKRWGAMAPRARQLTGTVAALFYLGYFFVVTAANRQDFTTTAALTSLGWMLGYGLGLVLSGALALWWGMHITERWWDRHAGARNPDAVVADELLRILETVEKSPAEWGQLRGRNKVLRSLELAARCLEHNLPTRLQGQDPETDAWLREKAAGQAAAIRGLKRWVLVPKPDTREHFIERISQDLVRTTVGDWDGLECAEPAEGKPSRVRRAAQLLFPIAMLGVCAVILYDPTGGDLGWLQPVLVTFVLPVLVLAVIRVANPAMLADLPVVKQIQEMMPKREKE